MTSSLRQSPPSLPYLKKKKEKLHDITSGWQTDILLLMTRFPVASRSARLTDFGLARSGSESYAAPELLVTGGPTPTPSYVTLTLSHAVRHHCITRSHPTHASASALHTKKPRVCSLTKAARPTRMRSVRCSSRLPCRSTHRIGSMRCLRTRPQSMYAGAASFT